MIRKAILSTLALAIFVGCSEKKTEQTTVEAIPVKVQKLEKRRQKNRMVIRFC